MAFSQAVALDMTAPVRAEPEQIFDRASATSPDYEGGDTAKGIAIAILLGSVFWSLLALLWVFA